MRRLIYNTDRKTTAISAVLAAIMASNVDFERLLEGDKQQIALLISSILVALWGYYTNKQDRKK